MRIKTSFLAATLTGLVAPYALAAEQGRAPALAVQPAVGENSAVPEQRTVVRRSGLWTVIDTEHRSPSPATRTPHRLTEAQRRELREQVRRTSVRSSVAEPRPQPAPARKKKP